MGMTGGEFERQNLASERRRLTRLYAALYCHAFVHVPVRRHDRVVHDLLRDWAQANFAQPVSVEQRVRGGVYSIMYVSRDSSVYGSTRNPEDEHTYLYPYIFIYTYEYTVIVQNTGLATQFSEVVSLVAKQELCAPQPRKDVYKGSLYFLRCYAKDTCA
jgi:hypothetical protein